MDENLLDAVKSMRPLNDEAPHFPWEDARPHPHSGSQYIRGHAEEFMSRRSADRLEIRGRELAASLIRYEIELDLLAFDQMIEAGTLDGADMDEGILATVIRLDEAEALGGVKPFHGSHGHEENPFRHKLKTCRPACCDAQRCDRRIRIYFRDQIGGRHRKEPGAAK
jgi:hypothetical protein